MFEVIAEFGAFFLFAGDDASADDGFLLEVGTQLFQKAGVFGEALREDVLGAFEGCLDIGNAFFSV